MKKRIFLALAIIVATISVGLIIVKKFFTEKEETVSKAAVVIPNSNNEVTDTKQDVSMDDDDSTLVSLIPLHGNETLISIVSMDFDGDGFDDQVNAVKTMDSPYITLIIGLYNPKTSSYERKAELSTEIEQTQTFSYTGMDLNGEHRTALVYQGFAENGDSILKAYFISNWNDRFSLRKIVDLKGDGTIFIQQVDRYDSYERSKANGASFPIWVYTSDIENPKSTDQLQIEYEWNSEEYKYVKTRTIRVAGSRIAAKELAKIQDGTVATFAAFLDGLWYLNESDGSGVRYLFFNYDSREIIFFKGDTEEVYKWAHSNIRRNGMYLSTINQEIENLQRRVDISLKSITEIHIRIQDDVRMRISESNIWDGDYKKSNQNLFKSQLKSNSKKVDYKAELVKTENWKTAEGVMVKFSEGRYSVAAETSNDEGYFTSIKISGDYYVQFRSNMSNAFFDGLYKIVPDEENASAKSFVLQPCKPYADGIIPLEQRPVVITAVKDE